jgi:SAM-dependent methyltransferase
VTSGTIYDHPLYYDILFGWDRTPEADFYEAAFRRYAIARSEHVVEVACGPGLVARRLAQRGWRLTGIDSRSEMVAFLREQSAREGVSVDAICADMVHFVSSRSFGAAYSPLSSFRLIQTAREVEAHLRAMADVLRPAGVYILDMDLLGGEKIETATTKEEWEMTRRGITVRATNTAILVNDHGIRHTIDWADGTGHLLDYTAQALSDCVKASGCFSIEAWHPEDGRNAEGVSCFSVHEPAEEPVAGRAMVVLRRT